MLIQMTESKNFVARLVMLKVKVVESWYSNEIIIGLTILLEI